MVTIANPKGLNYADYMGKSDDPKPTDVQPNAIYWAFDTNEFFVYDADTETWMKVGGDS